MQGEGELVACWLDAKEHCYSFPTGFGEDGACVVAASFLELMLHEDRGM